MTLKIISVDFGLKQSGTAIINTDIGVCLPGKSFISQDSIIGYLKTEKPDVIVLGHPKVNEGDISNQERHCLDFKVRLESIFIGTKIELIDERMSTKLAKQKMKNIGIFGKKGKNMEDSLAALLILETYIANN